MTGIHPGLQNITLAERSSDQKTDTLLSPLSLGVQKEIYVFQESSIQMSKILALIPKCKTYMLLTSVEAGQIAAL